MASLFPAPAPLHEDPVHAGPTDQVFQNDGPQWWTFSARGSADVDGYNHLAFEPGPDTFRFRASEIVRAQKARGSLPRTVGTG
ncbi:hypothetical protein ACFYSF_35380 [Streptomyces canus]|uniref:hypothetical protein n=1 Tax=Streptomyces canus TaxID=58343 RepID=UPI0036BDDD4C